MEAGGFRLQSQWSNTEPNDPQWWWVYRLWDYPEDRAIYVGMTKDLPKRLRAHRRTWLGNGPRAHVTAVKSAEQARLLERTMIALFDPPGNDQKPQLSWEEQNHYDWLREEDWDICPACCCVVVRREEFGGKYLVQASPSAEDICRRHVATGGPALYAGVAATWIAMRILWVLQPAFQEGNEFRSPFDFLLGALSESESP